MDEKSKEIIHEAFQGILSHRDFLGHQLSHAQGIISEEDFEGIKEEYFRNRKSLSVRDLTSKIEVLREVLPEIDSDIVSAAFQCTIQKAMEALMLPTRCEKT